MTVGVEVVGPGGGPNLPPAQMAVRLGGGRSGRRLRRRVAAGWLVVSGLDALIAWGAWSLPTVLAGLVLALCAGFELVATVVVALALGVLQRASLASGPGWVGVRMLGRWRVVQSAGPVHPPGPGAAACRQPEGRPGPGPWSALGE